MKKPPAVLGVFSLLLLFGSSLCSAATWRSVLYPNDWVPGYTTAQGYFVHDFSYAGYHRGEAPIPSPNTTVLDASLAPFYADRTGSLDSTAAIQHALDAAEAAGGGIVYLPSGTYQVAPQGSADFALQIRGSNIVLRGAGASQTFLYNSTSLMREKQVIDVRSGSSSWWYADSQWVTKSALSQDLPSQSRIIPVVNAGLFAVNDLVVIRNDLTADFIADLGMTGKWTPLANDPKPIVFVRRVLAVDSVANTITVDIPTRYLLQFRDNARVIKLSYMISEVGLEDFSIGMAESTKPGLAEDDYTINGTAGYDLHLSHAVFFESAENCWMRRVNSYQPPGNAAGFHLASNGVRLSRTRCVTVEDCDLRHAQYKGGGGNGYLYILGGNDSLMRRCRAEDGRHNFDFQTMACSGNVLADCATVDGTLPADFHMYFSMANLIDNMTVDGNFLEAKYRDAGSPLHGVTSTENVFWNTNGLRYGVKTWIIYNRQFNKGYIVGTRGPANAVSDTLFHEGVGKGDTLSPLSLFSDQVNRRLHPVHDVVVASGTTYPLANGLGVGRKVYLESWDTSTYSSVPAQFLGLNYFQTSRNDVNRTENSFLTFQADFPVTVYVAYRQGFVVPTWLQSWQDTGESLVTSANITLRVRKQQFPAGSIVLGANHAGGGTSSVMYTVLISRP